MAEELWKIAAQFAGGREIATVRELGGGNVNDTFLVTCVDGAPRRFVLQRINTEVFRDVGAVIDNICLVTRHVGQRLATHRAAGDQMRWEVPELLASVDNSFLVRDRAGHPWRAMRYIEGAVPLERATTPAQARQAGKALGRLHALMGDLPLAGLRVTLPGFHQTPGYLRHYEQVLSSGCSHAPAELTYGKAFIEARRSFVPVLEQARERGELVPRPIHGDPKLNNILVDVDNGGALGMVDLDTLQPGLLHYDLGDGLRSCCNPAGEETPDLGRVEFCMTRCEAFLASYCAEMAFCMAPADYDYLYAATRLIALELGLRFFTDYLAGDVYFKTSRPGHNLHRALVQFRLVECIEALEPEFRRLVAGLQAVQP